MKAFLLAAGNGTRLRPLTNHTPKCLLPIQGEPLLDIWLRICRRSGVDQVLVNMHAHADAVREHVTKYGDAMQIKLFHEPHLLGSAGTLAANRGWVSSEPSFWVLYGDVLTNADLRPMLEHHRSSDEVATIGVYGVPDPHRCGIVSIDAEARVVDFVEKPAEPRGNLAFSGILIGTNRFIDEIRDHPPADLGHDVLPRLVNRMSAYVMNDYVLDIGTIENYQKAQATWPGFA